jgi:uncharacterized protein (TIGR03083 family)
MTMTGLNVPRAAALTHDAAMHLAVAEYQRFADLLAALRPGDWTTPTECPGWDVHAMAGHALGMVEMAASIRDGNRQVRHARRAGGSFIDALTALQVDEHAQLTPAQITERYARLAPKAARARGRVPGLIRRRTLPIPQRVGDRSEDWTVGYLLDIILTRDPWMHRVDITRVTGAGHVVTAEHDGVIVADVVSEWAVRHRQPFALSLTGLAGGSWTSGDGGPLVQLDAIEFCRIVSGRGDGDDLLATQVPF